MSRGRLVALLALPLLASAACKHSRAATPPAPPPGEVWLTREEVARDGVVVAPFDEHDVDDTLVTSGRVAFDEERVAHVLSPVTGQLVRIDGQLGQHVARGQLLAVVASPDLGLATADANKARADLIASAHAYARQRELGAGFGTSSVAVEQAEDAWRSARAENERAQQKVALLHAGRVVTQSYPLLSPIEGEVLARNVSPGVQLQGTYTGGTGPELFTVGDLGEVWLFADVYETELARVRAGEAVEVDTFEGEAPLVGAVDWVSGMLDPQTRTARLRCTIANAGGRLRPEMFVVARVAVAPVRALAVERSAVFPVAEYWYVLVDRGPEVDGRERFERVPVATDASVAGAWLPVKHGLTRGDRVVVKGVQAIAARL